MGEIKSVKVDNWGVFFLQKLQNFFNKTDYCDLTLQFRDNSQLKVHRLVLSACTDYFNVLEQTCDVSDDALIMPNELQADVVVPIVNFMYTGTLEFELKMYGKLLRTAKEMNMTVLLKLLEAHRRTMEGVNRSQRPPSPKAIRRRPVPAANPTQVQVQQLPPQRRVLTSANISSQPRRIVQMKNAATNASQIQIRQQIGSTSVVKTTSTGDATIFGSQVKTEVVDYDSSPKQPTSPFEQLRKGYNNNKRPASTTFISPPAKKPNIEDVKEFAEQQRMRKQIAAEFGEDHEYEGVMDDDIHNDDDDDDTAVPPNANNAAPSTSSRAQQQNATATITFKHEQPDKPPSIVIKDSSNSKMNHAKIISEVLRQYPHLVKGNRNIKLKIMPGMGGQSQKIIVRKEQQDNTSSDVGNQNLQHTQTISKPQISPQCIVKNSDKTGSSIVHKSVGAPTTANTAAITASSVVCSQTGTGTSQKRRIDSKTMHSLIALGAENTAGPWLCLRCGVNGRPISIPSYRGFRRHLINTHQEAVDPALCENCGWRSGNNRQLHFHMQVVHKIKSNRFTFPECLMCSETFPDNEAVINHMNEQHQDKIKQQCIYCNKAFATEQYLFIHMKVHHKKEALQDGIIDDSEEEFLESQEELDSDEQEHISASLDEKKDTKIKIISDISLPVGGSVLKLEPSSEADALSTVASGIATSIGIRAGEEFISEDDTSKPMPEPKFVNADGNEMVLTDAQRREIMSHLNQEHEGVVMVLNESNYETEPTAELNANEEEEIQDDQEDAIAKGDDEVAEESAEDDEFDDSQIYTEFATQTSNTEARCEEPENKKNNSTQLEESKESAENLEWAENLISAHDLEEESRDINKTSEKKAKGQDEINDKLKELTSDWSEDDIEEEEMDISDAKDGHLESLAKEEQLQDDVKDEDCNVEAENKLEKEDPANDESKSADSKTADDVDRAMRSLHREIIGATNSVCQEKNEETDEDKNETKMKNDESEMKGEEAGGSKNVDANKIEASKEVGEVAINQEFVDTIKMEKEDGNLHTDEKTKTCKTEVLCEDEDSSNKLLDEIISEVDEAKHETPIGKEEVAKLNTDDKIEDDSKQTAEINTSINKTIESDVRSATSELAIDTKDIPIKESEDVEVRSKTANINTEKVKSLISEWVEDEVDEEEEEEEEDEEDL